MILFFSLKIDLNFLIFWLLPATAYDGLYHGVGFFNNNNNNTNNAKQNPDSCKIKKTMQFYTG